jgi:hypothetical protein
MRLSQHGVVMGITGAPTPRPLPPPNGSITLLVADKVGFLVAHTSIGIDPERLVGDTSALVKVWPDPHSAIWPTEPVSEDYIDEIRWARSP